MQSAESSILLPSELQAYARLTRLEKFRLENERLRSFILDRSPGRDQNENDQYGFYYSPAKIRIASGGDRSSKTETGAFDILSFCLGVHPVRSPNHPPPVYCRACAPKYEENCKKVLLKKFRTFVPHYQLHGSTWKSAWSEKSKTVYFANGSTIDLKSYEMDVDTYAGVDLDAFWMDEHGEEKYFIENFSRTADRNGYGILTFTPNLGQTWEFTLVDSPPKGVDVKIWYFWFEKNSHLSAEGRKSIISNVERNPQLAEAKLYGRPVILTGAVLPQWNTERHIVPDFTIPKDWPRTFVIDPHHRKPSAMLWGAWDRAEDKVIVYRTAKKQMTVKELANYIRVKSAGEKIDLFIGDEAMGGDGKNIYGDESVLAQLRSQGIPIVGTNQGSDKTFEAGINKIRERLSPDPISQKVGFVMFESCNYALEWIGGKAYGSLAWEMSRYRYKKEQKSDEENFREKVANIDNDLIDCTRYLIQAGCVDSRVVDFGINVYGGGN